MYEHFKNIERLYGECYVQMPNGIFRDLSDGIKNKEEANIQQISFAYVYLVTISFLYKYAHFVDLDNGTYIQNSDIKQILGYNKTTKTIDKLIKRGGILEDLGLISTTKKYPVYVEYTENKSENLSMREFVTIDMIDKNFSNYKKIKSIVKNKNYEIKEPTFFFQYKEDVGSLYNYERTHKITLKEFINLVFEEDMDNIEILLYFFFKYKCYGLKRNMKSLALYKIILEIGISRDAFYKYLNNLKDRGFVNVSHKGWYVAGKKHNKNIEANEYYFKGIY